VNDPLGCHKPRVPDRIVFEKLVQALVFGCAYHRIADKSCSESTLRRRRDERIEGGVMGPRWCSPARKPTEPRWAPSRPMCHTTGHVPR